LEQRLRELSGEAYHAVGCRGAARVDFRIHPNGRPYVLELNTIPGMTARSLLPMAAAHHGMTYDDLVDAMLQSALLKRGRVASQPMTMKRKMI
jgi:D-alanine-D-alanine ligase